MQTDMENIGGKPHETTASCDVKSSGRKKSLTGCWRALLLPVLLLVVWSVTSLIGLVLPVFLPTPLVVLRALTETISDGSLLSNVSASCYRILMGFLISLAAALPLGTVMGSSSRIKHYVEPLNDFIRYIPVPAMVPLLILWLGVSDRCQIAVIVFGTLPQLLVMVVDSVTSMPSAFLDICKTLHLNRFQMLRYAYIPYASPQIYDAGRVSVGWAWSYLVVAEIIGANRGVGQSIIVAQRFLRTDQVMAGILVIAVLGLTTDLTLRGIYPHLFPWAERTRQLRT